MGAPQPCPPCQGLKLRCRHHSISISLANKCSSWTMFAFTVLNSPIMPERSSIQLDWWGWKPVLSTPKSKMESYDKYELNLQPNHPIGPRPVQKPDSRGRKHTASRGCGLLLPGTATVGRTMGEWGMSAGPFAGMPTPVEVWEIARQKHSLRRGTALGIGHDLS